MAGVIVFLVAALVLWLVYLQYSGDFVDKTTPDLFDFLNNAATTAHTVHSQEKDLDRALTDSRVHSARERHQRPSGRSQLPAEQPPP